MKASRGMCGYLKRCEEMWRHYVLKGIWRKMKISEDIIHRRVFHDIWRYFMISVRLWRNLKVMHQYEYLWTMYWKLLYKHLAVLHDIPCPCRERYFIIFDGTSGYPNISSDFTVFHDIRTSSRALEQSQSHCNLLPPCPRGSANWYQVVLPKLRQICRCFKTMCMRFVLRLMS